MLCSRGKIAKTNRSFFIPLVASLFLLASVNTPNPLLAGQSEHSIEPLPQSIDLDASKVNLGRQLFHDKRLSRNNSISCSSCHNVNTNGADSVRHSIGWSGKKAVINTPTVFNSGFNDAQFWDGRVGTLEEQVYGPIHNPAEMGSNWKTVLLKLRSDKKLMAEFAKIYRDKITPKSIEDAIATYERSLVTPNSKFDVYLRGNDDAITAQEKKGYALFQTLGCIACHQGRNVGGNLFQRLGIFEDYFTGRKITRSDLGRYNITKRQEDYFVFKVPSLRNVALTAPYLHDGSAETLEDVVQIMALYQLGLSLSMSDTENIIAFLNTLTGTRGWTKP